MQKILIENSKKLSPAIGEQALHFMLQRPWMGAGYFPLFYDAHKKYSNYISKKISINKTAAGVPFQDINSLFFKKYIHSISNGKLIQGLMKNINVKLLDSYIYVM